MKAIKKKFEKTQKKENLEPLGVFCSQWLFDTCLKPLWIWEILFRVRSQVVFTTTWESFIFKNIIIIGRDIYFCRWSWLCTVSGGNLNHDMVVKASTSLRKSIFGVLAWSWLECFWECGSSLTKSDTSLCLWDECSLSVEWRRFDCSYVRSLQDHCKL